MTPGLDPALKRTRVSTSKVRTGCSTCKARRVKCDEAKPTCRRCTIGRRKCEYTLTPVAPRPRNVITVYLPPAQSQPAFFINDRDLDFFHRNLAIMLDGQFDSKFWSKLVLQLSHSEPSIRHAVSAISVTYRDVELSLQQPSGYVSLNSEAQQEWSLAIRSLSARIQARPESNLVSLVCCLVFTCIELLRGNIDSSLFHVQNGFNIMATLDRRSNVNPEMEVNLSSEDLEAIEDHIAPVFLGLNVLCSLAGIATPSIYTLTSKQVSHHEGLTDFRRRLCEISDTCIRFIGQASLKAGVFQINFNDLVEQAKLQTSLDLWRDQLDRHVEQMEAAGIPVNRGALNQLLVQHKVVHIWTRVCTMAGEMATDSYHADFEELVHHAEQVVNSNTGMATPQPLSFDIQTLGPLYYAALKCRYAATRRRALEMLRSAPRREGLWNAHYAYATAKRVIEVEERHLTKQGLPDETARVHHLPLPDDQSRIHNPFNNFEKVGHDGLPNPPDPCVLRIMFYTKPWGLLGQWQTTTEYIEL